MAIIAYDDAPTLDDELGPGSIRRQYRPTLFCWTGNNNPSPALANRWAFADMMWLASFDWWTALNQSQRDLWFTWATNIHHARPGNAGTNTHKQPFSRFVTSAGYLGYWYLAHGITGPALNLAHIDAIAISAYHANPQSVDVVVTIDATGTASPNVMLDLYQHQPNIGLPWLSWHCFKNARHFAGVVSGIHTYTLNVPLKYFQPPASMIFLWSRLRNGQDANEFNLLAWQL
jgi:hypothetical protein